MDAIVAEFGHVQRPIRSECHIVRIRQLAGIAAGFAPFPDECAVAVEHLNPMVVRVGDIQQSVGPQCHRADVIELTVLRPLCSPTFHNVTVRIELGDPFVRGKF